MNQIIKITNAEDLISEARGYIDCVFMAAASLTREDGHAISTVANIASDKINEAMALLNEYRTANGFGPPASNANESEESQ